MKKATECEMSVIGALLCSEEPEAIVSAFGKITGEHFEQDELREIYGVLAKVYRQTGKADYVLVLRELPQEQKALLLQCMDMVPAPSLLPHYVNALCDQYRRRVLARDVERIGLSLSEEAPTEEILRELSLAAQTQEKLRDAQQSTSLDMMDSVIEYIKSLYLPNEKPIKTGFSPLDKKLGGLIPKSVNILSGRSGMGKSDFAIFLAVSLAVQGIRVLYLSMEMPRTQIMARIASRVTTINSSRLNDADSLSPSEKTTVSILLEKLSKIPLTLDEQQGLTVAAVAAKIRKHRPQVVFIDHMQLMAQENPRRPGWENLAETSRGLKRLAMNENVILFELVQQNAEVERRNDKTPKMSDVKGTDVYTNDGDTLMFLQANRPMDEMGDRDSVDVTLYITKSRHSSPGAVHFRWQPQIHRYLAIAPDGGMG